MIVASRKPIPELKEVLAKHDKVLFAGCGTCVTVCLSGGEREVGIISSAMRMARRLDGRPIEIEQVTIERQCENEFIQDLAGPAERNEAILSFGCGAGVQAIAERFPGSRSTPRSTRSSSASSKSRRSGRRSAWGAVRACFRSSAASAR